MPLAHILAPQIAKKAQQIEAELGHAPAGYLEQQNVGFEKTPQYDPRGLMDKPEPKRYDPRTPAGSALAMLGSMKKYDPKLAEQIVRGMQKAKVQEGVKPIPNAPVPAQPEPAKPAKGKRGRVVIPAGKPGEPVAVNERGESIDSRGKNLGYLNQPALATPYGDVPLSNPVRTPKNINVQPKDQFDAFWLEEHFGKHLKAMQDNRDANGMPTDQFPPGYFQGMSKTERENIIKGVDALRKFQKGTRV